MQNFRKFLFVKLDKEFELFALHAVLWFQMICIIRTSVGLLWFYMVCMLQTIVEIVILLDVSARLKKQ